MNRHAHRQRTERPPRPRLGALSRDGAIIAALVTALAAIYLATFGGRVQSGDELYLLDATRSLAQFGDLLLSVSAGIRPPSYPLPTSAYPLPSVGTEPLQIVLAAPLHALAAALPGVGLAHATLLFNVGVGALAGGVLYAYARTLGYRPAVAVLGALALGLGTVLWPYTRSFFREPLTLLLLLLSGLAAERWRRSRYRAGRWLLAMLVAVVALALTKATAMLALPALAVIVLPSPRRLDRRALLALALLALLVAGVFLVLALFGDRLGVGTRYNPVARLIEESRDFALTALRAYLLSPGGSLWGTSPITLLALPGLWLLWRRRKPRYVLAVPLLALAFAAGYAASSGPFWFGGLAWPPRFLVPVVPWLVLGGLPVLDAVMRPGARWPARAAVAALALVSVWVQLGGVTIPWGDYTRLLPPEANGLFEWSGGLYDPRYLRPVVLPTLWGQAPLDIAWLRAGLPGWLAGWLLLTAVALGLAVRLARGGTGRKLAPALLAALALGVGLGLRALYDDPYYAPPRPGLLPVMDVIAAETGPGDVVLLSNREYENAMFNYGAFDGARVIGLGDQRGDRPSETQAPHVESDNPSLLLDKDAIALIHNLAATRERLWVLENKGPDFPWAVRPVERFMAEHYYPLRVLQTAPPDPTVRLIEYSTTDAPDPYAFRGPETLTDLTFGELRLTGYTLSRGARYRAGEALPIAFSWQATAPPARDYRVAWFLRDANGGPVAQGMDSRPGGDFEATSAWTPGAPHWDNRALRLPEGLAPGAYRLWVKVYWLDETFAPRDLPVTGGDTRDGVIGVLPTAIVVE